VKRKAAAVFSVDKLSLSGLGIESESHTDADNPDSNSAAWKSMLEVFAFRGLHR
jgi:hypothetical protein